MSEWATAWDNEEDDAATPSRGARVTLWSASLFGLAFALWLFAYGTGLYTTLGSIEGNERHDRNLVRLADDSSFGLKTMYVFSGQHIRWDYDVTVEGRGGVRLHISKVAPSPAFVSRYQDVAATARGRFEVIAPEAGLYRFAEEPIPQGALFGGGEAGATRYRLSWGVD
jgi:hypothetical protein